MPRWWIALGLLPLLGQACSSSNAALDAGGEPGPDVVAPDGGLDGVAPDAGLDAVVGDSGRDAADARPTDASPTDSSVGDVSLKPICQGVMPENYTGGPPAADSFIVDSVVELKWKDLQVADADAGNAFPSAAWQPLDNALADANVHGVRLRVMAGIDSPPFVKSLGGYAVSGTYNGTPIDCSAGGIAVVDPQNGASGCVPAFWTTPVLDVYGQLLAHMATSYGSNPKFREVADSACMTVYAEPFVRGHGEPGTVARLYQAGFDITKDQACESAVVTMFQGLAPAFAGTRLSLALNPWDEVLTDGGFTTSWNATYNFVTSQRRILGPLLALQINHLNPGYVCNGGSPSSDEACFMGTVEPPKGAQTWAWSRLAGTGDGGGALDDSLQRGVALGFDFVEVPPEYTQTDPTALHALHDALVANDAGP